MSYFFHFVFGSRFKAAATAFKTGEYGGTTYSGKYGDMAAMTAAIMLDPEARASILDSDNAHGQMREPVLKVMHMLRSLEYKSKSEMEINLFKLGESIGQFAFQSPSVFNFYLPEFSPAGPVQEAGLVAPRGANSDSAVPDWLFERRVFADRQRPHKLSQRIWRPQWSNFGRPVLPHAARQR